MEKILLGIALVCLSLPILSGGCKKVPLMAHVNGECDCVSCECSDQRVLDVVRQELAKNEVSRALDVVEATTVSTNRSTAKPASKSVVASHTDGVVFSDDPLPAGAVITHINGVPVARQVTSPSTGTVYSRQVYTQAPVIRRLFSRQVVTPPTYYRAVTPQAQPTPVYAQPVREWLQAPTSGTCRIVNGVKICN
jgi:ribosomal protein L14